MEILPSWDATPGLEMTHTGHSQGFPGWLICPCRIHQLTQLGSGIYNMTTPAEHSDIEAPAGLRVVEISRQPVELYKILKFESLAASGGQAKAVVAAGQVLVNGEVETRKRKKIVSGDTIEYNDHKIRIKLATSIVPKVAAPNKEMAARKSRPALAQDSTKK